MLNVSYFLKCLPNGKAASSLFNLQTSPKVSEKKGATCQSFIRKEITTYRIGTLVEQLIIKPFCDNNFIF